MLLKWIFTLLAIYWLIQVIKPLFTIQSPPPPKIRKQPEQEEGEYIDYEEIE